MPLDKDDIQGGLKKTPPRPKRERKRYTDTSHGAPRSTDVLLPTDRHITVAEAKAHRASRVSDPTSGTGALAAATGGSYAFDKPAMLRPEDVDRLHLAARRNPGVRMMGQIVSDPSGVIGLVGAANELRKNPGVASGAGAGLAAAGLFVPGLRKLKGAKLEPVVDAAKRPAGAAEVAGSLAKAKPLRREQEKLYSQERAKRIANYRRLHDEAIGSGLDPEEAHRAAMTALKGELPKLEFTAGRELSPADKPGLLTHIHDHPDLREWERVRAKTAVDKIYTGTTPTKSEIRLLGRAFGEQDAKALAGSASFWKQARDAGVSLLNVPRALKASVDFSAPFRQALVLGARHPKLFAKEWGPGLKALRSEGAYEDVMDDIAKRPTFQIMRDSKLALTDLEDVATREEQFMSNLAEKIPVAGRLVRGSGRGYVAFLNKFRADAFDHYLQVAEKQGRELSEKELRDIASWVNHATGRGSIKGLEGAMPAMNAVMFSPRLIASRLQLLNPVYYGSLSPFARKQALQGMAQLLGGISLTLYLAKLAGAQVGMDPRSADFGKIKVGNTRVDVMGGFQQYIVQAARQVKGEMVSSTTGDVVKLEGGYAKPSRADIALNFAEGKLAPIPRFVDQWAHNENDDQQPFNPAREFPKLFAPLGIENAVSTYKQEGGKAAGVGLGLGSIGFGVQTYGPQSDKNFRADIKTIDDAVKAGRMDGERAAEAKRHLRRVYWVQKHPSEKNKRLYLIEQLHEHGRDLDGINRVLQASGYDTASLDDVHDAELAALEAEAVR